MFDKKDKKSDGVNENLDALFPDDKPSELVDAPVDDKVLIFINSDQQAVGFKTKSTDQGKKQFLEGGINGVMFEVPCNENTYVSPQVYEAVKPYAIRL